MLEILKSPNELTALEALKTLPEELLWQQNFNSPHSIRAYSIAVKSFMAFLGIDTFEQLRTVNHAHVIAFKKRLQTEGKSPRTINNRLSALSSLFNHLIEKQIVKINPALGVKRMRVNSDRVEAKVLTPKEARKMLEAPDTDTLKGLRDRALLGVLFYTGCRAAEVCKLKVKDYYYEREYWCLDFEIKGGKRNATAIHQESQAYINQYLRKAGHGDDKDFPLLLPVKTNSNYPSIRGLSVRLVEVIWQQYALKSGIFDTYPHSARATFITEALENGCEITDVQASVGHSRIDTTRSYYKKACDYRNSASLRVHF